MTEEQMKINQERIIEKLLDNGRPGMEDLVDYMIYNGFFTAPCSGSYHLAEEGGLAEHSLNVLLIAEELACSFCSFGFNGDPEELTIACLLHDLGKMGQYGKPNYVATKPLKSGKPAAKPFETNKELLYIPHEVRSVSIAQMFINLTEREQSAILYHNGLYGSFRYELQGKETPLYLILHTADMWASRFWEVE